MPIPASLWVSDAADLVRLEILAPLALGLGCALFVFLFGGMLLGRRPKPPTLPVAKEPPRPPTTEVLPEEGAWDRRVALRRTGHPVEVQLAIDDRVLTHGRVVDRSVSGLCLNVNQIIETGTILNVKPTGAAATMPWTEIEVRSCRPEGAEWQIGCRYVRTPPWNVRMLFG